MQRVELEKHYGAMVHTNTYTDKLRKSQCLCLNCVDIDQCDIAKKLYETCKEYDLALMVTRCKNFTETDLS